MNSLMIIYLLGCATAFVQSASDIYIGYKEYCKDVIVSDIFQVICATIASWAFVAANFVSGYTKFWNKVIIKSKQKKE